MYIVYSTTKSSELYPVNVLMVAGVPALAVNVPERLVVIPTSVPPPPDTVVQVDADPEPFDVKTCPAVPYEPATDMAAFELIRNLSIIDPPCIVLKI